MSRTYCNDQKSPFILFPNPGESEPSGQTVRKSGVFMGCSLALCNFSIFLISPTAPLLVPAGPQEGQVSRPCSGLRPQLSHFPSGCGGDNDIGGGGAACDDSCGGGCDILGGDGSDDSDD